MLNNLKIKNALFKIFELIFTRDINKLLSINSKNTVGKMVKQYLINTSIVSLDCSNNFNLEALDFETQKLINDLKNLMKQDNQKINFDKIIDKFDNVDNIKLWICITIILQNFKNEFIIFENQEERQMCSETILKIIDNSSNFSLFYKSLSNGELDYINKLSMVFNFKSMLSEFRDYFDIVHSMQQWLLSLPKYTWVISKYYIGKNKYADIDSKFLKFRDMLKIFPLNPVQTIRFKISEIFGTTNFADLLKNIKNAKEYFESLVLALKDNIFNDLNYIFDGDFKKWLRELSNEKKKFLYENSEEQIFSFENISNSQLLDSICDMCVGIKLNDFDNDTPSKIFMKLVDIKNTIENQTNDVTVVNINDLGIDYKFQRAPQSTKIGILSDEIISILQEYGKSLTINEKRTSLLDVLQVKNL